MCELVNLVFNLVAFLAKPIAFSGEGVDVCGEVFDLVVENIAVCNKRLVCESSGF